ncbi:putative lipoprotein [Enhygromyxa salina]|uniref:Putative lipoprotein n=1 Tax=Enhygromyxa salina TaxID=215803 RepID=A0A0C2DIH4_9BACT|nr:putative lipoprotein [Enhygromyxa salina]
MAGLTGCAVDVEDGGAEGQTTTSMGSGQPTDTDGGSESSDTGPVCEGGCEGAVEIAEGIVECSDGRINRVGGGTFDPAINAPGCAGTEDTLHCTSDADCSGEYTKCISATEFFEGFEATYCGCVSACATDSDCTDGRVCVPPGVLDGQPDWPTCMAVGCATNSDCGECGECGLGAFDDGCGWVQTIQCRTANDVCNTSDDCDPGADCFPHYDESWTCEYSGCAIGRPLLVEAQACTAAPCQRSDWAAPAPGFAGLAKDPQLAAHWAEIAALEHASVASFARFGSQLLALGAPARLLLACKRAALDEIEHARLAYGLASAYGGAWIGPGHLDLHGLVVEADWREVVRGLIVEACVGETLGVAEAMAAAEGASEGAVRQVLERIVADELRHAQLAWQSLEWLLTQASDDDRSWALALLERTIAAINFNGGTNEGFDRPAEGVLGGLRRAQVHRETSARVLAPLAQALAS